MTGHPVFYGQHAEDRLLWSFFDCRDDGFFVDVGAFDGIYLSNSYHFERRGWKGLCIEPHPDYFSLLEENRPGSICLNLACSADDEPGEVDFSAERSGLFSSLGGVDEATLGRLYEGAFAAEFTGVRRVAVAARTLNAVLSQHAPSEGEIDFISINVAGTEIDVLRGLDLDRHRPRVLVVGSDAQDHRPELLSWVGRFGYQEARLVGSNTFCVRDTEDVDRLRRIPLGFRTARGGHPLGPQYTLETPADAPSEAEARLVTAERRLRASERDRAAQAAIIQGMVSARHSLKAWLKLTADTLGLRERLHEIVSRLPAPLTSSLRWLWKRLPWGRPSLQLVFPEEKERRRQSDDLRPGEPLDHRLRSPLVETFALCRALDGTLGDEALIGVHEYGRDLHRVLALASSVEAMQVALMLKSAGVEVTCLGQPHTSTVRLDSHLTFESEPLPRWLARQAPVVLAGYDGIVVDAESRESQAELLRGRLWPGNRMMLTGPSDAVGPIARTWGSPTNAFEGVRFYDRLPEDWLDPAYLCQEMAVPIPSLLPSGRPWPVISIVTVTYNQGAYLEETLRSVLSQRYPALEYIVIDGGSTDETSQILERYRDRLAYCVSEEDEGQSDALNKGFSKATGNILAWLNSDDRYLPGTLVRVAQAFDRYRSDLVAGGCALVRNRAAAPFRVHHPRLPFCQVVPLPLERLLDLEGAWLEGDFFYQPEVFWTRDLWERCGSRVANELHFSMDYDLWARMAHESASIVTLPDALALFRVHSRQKTAGSSPPYLPELRRHNAALKERWGGVS